MEFPGTLLPAGGLRALLCHPGREDSPVCKVACLPFPDLPAEPHRSHPGFHPALRLSRRSYHRAPALPYLLPALTRCGTRGQHAEGDQPCPEIADRFIHSCPAADRRPDSDLFPLCTPDIPVMMPDIPDPVSTARDPIVNPGFVYI